MAQTILVTGSTSGFGRLTVETLARQGYRVSRHACGGRKECPWGRSTTHARATRSACLAER